jgi:membrane-associated PAP2 superfamily phosphatase
MTSHTLDHDMPRSKLFSALVGVVALDIVLQGVWAGMFIREGKANNHDWVDVHAVGAYVAIVIAVATVVVATTRLRARRDLVLGSVALLVLLVIETGLGSLIGNHPGVSAVHIPVALALIGLAVWLPVRARG